MSRALPLIVVAILTSAGTWQVSVPGLLATASADPATVVVAGEVRQASQRSIAGRGQVSRDAVPAATPARGGAAPEERRSQTVHRGGGGQRAPPRR